MTDTSHLGGDAAKGTEALRSGGSVNDTGDLDNRPHWYHRRRRSFTGSDDNGPNVLARLVMDGRTASLPYLKLSRSEARGALVGGDLTRCRRAAHEFRETARVYLALAELLDPMNLDLAELHEGLRRLVEDLLQGHQASGLTLKQWMDSSPYYFQEVRGDFLLPRSSASSGG